MPMNELSDRIINIERNILELKTAIVRTNSSTAGIWQSTSALSPGTYTITYENGQFPIMTTVETARRGVSVKAPSGNTQTFKMLVSSKVRITSTRKIISVQ